MDPAELEAVMAVTSAFLEELSSSGALVFAGGLHPPSTAVTVDHTGEDLTLADGPFTQAPEYLGGSAWDWRKKAFPRERRRRQRWPVTGLPRHHTDG
jgi:hypothetical protein